MITAVDTNVLLDVFGSDPTFGRRSQQAMRGCAGEGRLVACDVVWTETASFFPSSQAAEDAMARLEVDFDAVPLDAALAAGAEWRTYRARGGTRARVVADFLVGAHAAARADRLLSRDRGFYRTYFARLPVLDPGE